MKNFQYGNFQLESGIKFGLIYTSSVDCVGPAIYTRSDVQAAPIRMSKAADFVEDLEGGYFSTQNSVTYRSNKHLQQLAFFGSVLRPQRVKSNRLPGPGLNKIKAVQSLIKHNGMQSVCRVEKGTMRVYLG